ncbi:hypothetical protein KIN20_024006 [Parelaphostrongylus tenuis]|uniref:NTR domain-containing protein n=1 Tax=Parelaphostrongylus tenuis TaxID=148309 RepID=A0AAD5N9N4_PARTN|nr:hypothetical protein KIN20_024006 [Parelaphostrongylus tenuis]
MMIAVCLLALVSTAIACSCHRPSSVKHTFCGADLVSHVKVISRHEEGDDFFTSESVYGLDHIEVYKKPLDNQTLPSVVYSSPESLCGLTMELGKEYLLTGYRSRGDIYAHLCGQVNDGSKFGAVEWHTVSQDLRANLKKFQC